MKASVWIYAATVAFTVFAVWAVSGVLGTIIQQQLHGQALPPISQFFFDLRPWLWLIPLTWLAVAAWLSRGARATVERCLIFAGISTLAVVFILTFSAEVLALPFVRIIHLLE